MDPRDLSDGYLEHRENKIGDVPARMALIGWICYLVARAAGVL